MTESKTLHPPVILFFRGELKRPNSRTFKVMWSMPLLLSRNDSLHETAQAVVNETQQSAIFLRSVSSI